MPRFVTVGSVCAHATIAADTQTNSLCFRVGAAKMKNVAEPPASTSRSLATPNYGEVVHRREAGLHCAAQTGSAECDASVQTLAQYGFVSGCRQRRYLGARRLVRIRLTTARPASASSLTQLTAAAAIRLPKPKINKNLSITFHVH